MTYLKVVRMEFSTFLFELVLEDGGTFSAYAEDVNALVALLLFLGREGSFTFLGGVVISRVFKTEDSVFLETTGVGVSSIWEGND